MYSFHGSSMEALCFPHCSTQLGVLSESPFSPGVFLKEGSFYRSVPGTDPQVVRVVLLIDKMATEPYEVLQTRG